MRTAEEKAIARAKAEELAKQKGRLVFHVTSRRISTLKEVYVDGGVCVDDSKYFASFADAGIPITPAPDDPTYKNVRRLDEPFAVLESGDAFWIGSPESAWVVLSDEAKQIADNVRDSLTKLVAGAAMISARFGLSPELAIAIVVSALDHQAAVLRARR